MKTPPKGPSEEFNKEKAQALFNKNVPVYDKAIKQYENSQKAFNRAETDSLINTAEKEAARLFGIDPKDKQGRIKLIKHINAYQKNIETLQKKVDKDAAKDAANYLKDLFLNNYIESYSQVGVTRIQKPEEIVKAQELARQKMQNLNQTPAKEKGGTVLIPISEEKAPVVMNEAQNKKKEANLTKKINPPAPVESSPPSDPPPPHHSDEDIDNMFKSDDTKLFESVAGMPAFNEEFEIDNEVSDDSVTGLKVGGNTGQHQVIKTYYQKDQTPSASEIKNMNTQEIIDRAHKNGFQRPGQETEMFQKLEQHAKKDPPTPRSEKETVMDIQPSKNGTHYQAPDLGLDDFDKLAAKTQIEKNDNPTNADLAVLLPKTQPKLREEMYKVMKTLDLGTFLKNEWSLVKEIGSGGFSTVYLLYDKAGKKYKALKTNKSPIEDDIARFQQEYRYSSHLFEKNNKIGRTETFVNCGNGHQFVVMEYCKGMNLEELLEKQGPLATMEEKDLQAKLPELLKVMSNIADALYSMHEKKVLHRDLKAANIMYNPKDKKTKVMDLGIACKIEIGEDIDDMEDDDGIHDAEKLETDEVGLIGTPEIMSPEQLQGKLLNHKADMYSLGATLYKLITGNAPYSDDNDTMHELIYKIISSKDLDAPFDAAVIKKLKSPKLASLAKRTNKVALRCLERHRIDRYDNLDEVRKELEAIVFEFEASWPKKLLKGILNNPKTSAFAFYTLLSTGGAGLLKYHQDALRKAEMEKNKKYEEELLRSAARVEISEDSNRNLSLFYQDQLINFEDHIKDEFERSEDGKTESVRFALVENEKVTELQKGTDDDADSGINRVELDLRVIQEAQRSKESQEKFLFINNYVIRVILKYNKATKKSEIIEAICSEKLPSPKCKTEQELDNACEKYKNDLKKEFKTSNNTSSAEIEKQ